MSCHRAFNNSDIVDEIFEWLILSAPLISPSISPSLSEQEDEDEFFEEEDRLHACTLARLARVCRAFQEPALNRLWAKQYGLRPTLALLPITLAGSPSTLDPAVHHQLLQRLRFYSKRVKDLTLDGRYTDPSIIVMLLWLCRGQALFHSLLSLNLEFIWPTTPDEALLFFSPTLRSLALNFGRDLSKEVHSRSKLSRRQQQELCVQILIKRSPGLQHFSVFQAVPFAEAQSLNAIFNLEDLRHLYISEVSMTPSSILPSELRKSWLRKISSMRSLRILSFDLQEIAKEDSGGEVFLGELDDLQRLHLTGDSATITSVLSSVYSPKLQEISITETSRWESDADRRHVEQCFTTLVERNKGSLKDVQFITSVNATLLYADVPSLFIMFRPLTQLRRLETLTIRVAQQVSLSDDEMSSLSASFSNLRNLEISPIYGNPRPGMQSLAPLASHCPNLRSIRLDLDLQLLPPLEDIPCMNHALRFLDVPSVGDKNSHRLEEVATIINRLFPALDTSPYGSNVPWQVVMDKVDSLRNAGE